MNDETTIALLTEIRDLLEQVVTLLAEQNVTMDLAEADEEGDTWRDPDTP
jgi:DNA-binding protein H-NS